MYNGQSLALRFLARTIRRRKLTPEAAALLLEGEADLIERNVREEAEARGEDEDPAAAQAWEHVKARLKEHPVN